MTEKWQRWNRDELAILKKCYPNMPRDDLMRLLPGRTWRSIGHQAETEKIHRPHYGTTRSKEYLVELHTTLSNARQNRTSGYAPFAGKHHSAEAKLTISISNLHTRGHNIADIAQRKGIAKEKVISIIEGREERGMSKEAEIEKEAKTKAKSVEPFIRANPHTGQWEPIRNENEQHNTKLFNP